MASTTSKKGSIKQLASKMVRDLADNATWDDLMYQIYVRQKIEAGLADLKKGRVHSHEAIKKELGLAS